MTEKVKKAATSKTCTVIVSAVGGALAVTNPEIAAVLKAVLPLFF
ncbi:hypothetical protein [Pseudoalteromonas peptidolytica]|nr:hypothetical protein [Pseudoalteromonas peptidolytica]MDW7548199.1 hypothetical protein [Pseudoalteromonas peptidolytica]